MSALTKDWIERTVWLALFAILGVLIQQVTDIATWWAPLIMLGLQQVRNLVTRKIGDPNTVSVLK